MLYPLQVGRSTGLPGRKDFMSYKNCLLSEILKSSERARRDRSGKFFIKVKRIWLLEKIWRIKKNGFLSFSSI